MQMRKRSACSESPGEEKTVGQKVTWTATVKGKPLNHGSGNFVHIVND